jgi:hypothetical protein
MLRLQQIGGGEDGPYRVPLARQSVIGRADAMHGAQRMGGDEGLRIADRRVVDDLPGAVVGAAVGVDEQRPLAREVAREAEVHGADRGLDRGRVVEGRHPDQDVDLTGGDQVAQHLVGEDALDQRSLPRPGGYSQRSRNQ